MPSSAARPPRSPDLPQGAVVGTSSLRRQAQVKHLRPDLDVVPMRGNVETRLRKLEDGVADATLLACAGLKRLGLADRITAPVPTDEMLPAVAQGAIGVEIRVGDYRDGRAAGADQRRADRACRHRRARLSRQARGLLPHADRRPCGARRRPFRLPGHDPHARRPRVPRDAARRPPRGGVALAEDAAAELLAKAGPDFFRALS